MQRPWVRPLLRLPLIPASWNAGSACFSQESWELLGKGPKPQPHLSLLCSRHCGRGKGPPDVLGLGGAGGAAVSVGQGKMDGCHVSSLAPSLSRWYLVLFLPFLRRPRIPLLSLLLAASVTHLVLEAHPYLSSPVTPPRAGTHWFL